MSTESELSEAAQNVDVGQETWNNPVVPSIGTGAIQPEPVHSIASPFELTVIQNVLETQETDTGAVTSICCAVDHVDPFQVASFAFPLTAMQNVAATQETAANEDA